jgi:hypothetical protein
LAGELRVRLFLAVLHNKRKDQTAAHSRLPHPVAAALNGEQGEQGEPPNGKSTM